MRGWRFYSFNSPSRTFRIETGADGIQQADQGLDVRVLEASHHRRVALAHRTVETREQLAAVAGDPAQHLPAIGRTALAPHQPFPLEPLHETRDPRGLLDHPLCDVEGR